MAKITKKQIALVHVAKCRLGLDEDAYRDILGQFGVKSSKELTRAQFKELMTVFERMGFARKTKKRVVYHPVASERTSVTKKGNPYQPMTDKQKEKIWTLWNLVSQAPPERREMALNKLVKRITRVDHWLWLNVRNAQKMIIALEKMKQAMEKKQAAYDR